MSPREKRVPLTTVPLLDGLPSSSALLRTPESPCLKATSPLSRRGDQLLSLENSESQDVAAASSRRKRAGSRSYENEHLGARRLFFISGSSIKAVHQKWLQLVDDLSDPIGIIELKSIRRQHQFRRKLLRQVF